MTSRRHHHPRVQPIPSRPSRRVLPPTTPIRVADLPPGSWDVVLPTCPGTHLRPTGACHDCGLRVSGERRFCGPCVVEHDARRYA